MKWAHLGLLVFLLFPGLFFAREGAQQRLLKSTKVLKPKEKIRKLYIVETHETIPVLNKAILPERVYLVFNQEQNGYFFALSDQEAKFSAPEEFFAEGSVLPGLYLGSKNPYQKYKLNAEGRWVPTKDEQEKHLLWNPYEPYGMKVISFIEIEPK